jgi:agmatine deiminase
MSDAESAYRLPAEWEPLESVWVVPPFNEATWPGCLEQARAQHRAWRKALAEAVWVRTTDRMWIDVSDSWVRDYGPLFVFDAQQRLVVQDFRFNGWGRKYTGWELDDAVAEQIGDALRLPVVRQETVLEGGALETDGRGTLLTTADCLLHQNRGGPGDRAGWEALLRATLGIKKTIWLTLPDGGLPGDDTDGHVDNAARFVNPETVVVHPDLDPTPLTDAGLTVVRLPAVEPMFYDYPADDAGPAERRPLPASYANFLIANGHVYVPTFGQPADDAALKILDQAMPDHKIVAIRSEHLVVGQGALHCLSMQQPAEISHR